MLDEVPLGLAEGEEKRGNPELGGYDCVIWTRDALRKLVEEGVVVLRGAKDIGTSPLLDSPLSHLRVD